MPLKRLALAPIIAACASSDVVAQGGDAARFDGNWRVVLTCHEVNDGARRVNGYTFDFSAEVTRGVLHGQHKSEGARGSLKLEGPIQPDGNAVLLAEGFVGDADAAVAGYARNSPYSYHVRARFEESRGAGQRVELRPCDFTFVKQ